MDRPLFGELARSELGLPRGLLKRALKRQRKATGQRRLGDVLRELVPAATRQQLDADLERVARMQEVFWPGLRSSRDRSRDLLLLVSGFDNRPTVVERRCRRLEKRLPKRGFTGSVKCFEWSCGRRKGRSRERWRARRAALELARHVLPSALAVATKRGGRAHVLAHSTGAFVLREALRMADQDNPGFGMLDQVVLCAADLARGSMAAGSPGCAALLRHCDRLTSYHNPHDRWLRRSRYDRPGVKQRLGRKGLAGGEPLGVVQVDCGAHYRSLKPDEAGRRDFSHCWYFEDSLFLKDLARTLGGDPWPGPWDSRSTGADGHAVLLRAHN